MNRSNTRYIPLIALLVFLAIALIIVLVNR